MSLKRELVFYADIGLVGTFVRWVTKATEKGYRYLEYVPLGSIPPKRKTLPIAIHEDHIFPISSVKTDIPGVIDRIIIISTEETGSISKKAFGDNNLKTIKELREKNRKLQMQVASIKQSEEDARSGVNKQIASMKQAQRGSSGGGFEGGSGFPQRPQQNYEYDDFDNY